MPQSLPKKALEIYEAALASAKKQGLSEERAHKVAWSAVKRAGYSKDKDTGKWHKMHLASFYITKATLGKDGVMRWAATVSKFAPDVQGDEITPAFFKFAKAQIDSGHRPSPVLCISHIDDGKPDDSWVAGDVTDLYIDGEYPKSKGTFRDTPLGKAAFEAVRADWSEGVAVSERVRVSLGFYDGGSEPLQTQKSDGTEINGRRFLKGWIKHLALTRVPVIEETEIKVMEAKMASKTKREDAASIVGEELADELTRADKAELDDDLILKADEEKEPGKAEKKLEKVKKDIEKEKEAKEAANEEKSISLDKLRDRVYRAWDAQHPGAGDKVRQAPWVREVFDDAVVVSDDSKTLWVPYSIDLETDEIEFGTPVQVQEVRRFVTVSDMSPMGDAIVVAVKARIEEKAEDRQNQIMGLLGQLADLLKSEWTVDTEIANAAATGNKGTNPPRATAAEKAEITTETTAENIAIQPPTAPESVQVAAFVDDFATRIKATLLSEGDRRDKYSALQRHLDAFGEGVATFVQEGTPPSGRDIADVVGEAVRAAVEPVRNELASVKAELETLKEKAASGATEPPVPQPRSLDTKARVISQSSIPAANKRWTAQQLAWASTGPGY